MGPWVMPLIRLITDNIEPIISAAQPLFTKKKAEDSANPIALLQQQVAELQAATDEGRAQLHQLAEQLKQTVSALEQAEVLADARHRGNLRLSAIALLFSLVAILVALIALFR